MIGEVVEDGVAGKVFAGHALAIEEDIFRLGIISFKKMKGAIDYGVRVILGPRDNIFD